VARKDHPSDRRVKLVVATEEGLAAAQLAERILDEPPASLLALSVPELVALESILAKVAAGVSEATALDDGRLDDANSVETPPEFSPKGSKTKALTVFT